MRCENSGSDSKEVVYMKKPTEVKSDAKMVPVIDWFVENVKLYDSKICLVSDRSQEGSQFCKGFGGVGGKI
jgi:peptide subunit release factor 1 (eRF1)